MKIVADGFVAGGPGEHAGLASLNKWPQTGLFGQKRAVACDDLGGGRRVWSLQAALSRQRLERGRSGLADGMEGWKWWRVAMWGKPSGRWCADPHATGPLA